MKKLIYLFILAIGFTSCSVESIDSTENVLTADMKIKIQQVDKSMNLKAEEICEGEAPVFVFNFPQDTKGNGDPKNTDVHIQVYNTDIADWVTFKKLSYAGAGPEEYTYEDEVLAIGTYDFRVSIGSGGFDYFATLDVVKCGCEESFTYVDNGNGTYIFTYTAGEDMIGAELVFTFAQGAYASGLNADFTQNGNGQTYKAIMDLEECDVLQYIVTLNPNCSGGSKTSNVWTDFKVDDHSKKADPEDKFTVNCN